MTKALKELLEKVEAGNLDTFYAPVWLRSDTLRIKAKEAHDGSLDAAKALHEALLPGWPWTIDVREVGWTRVWTDKRSGMRRLGYSGTCNDNPARAWLIAILKAKIAESEYQ